MKYTNKVKKLEAKQSDFKNDRTVQSALAKNPGSFHKPGSLKK